jgi:hypothetical protein
MPVNAKTTLCYLLSTAVADDVYMGGAMVTDIYGLPLEFRYTEPVIATKLQRILYGDVLDHYIQTDVILAHLMDTLEIKASIYIPDHVEFLNAIETLSRSAIWLGETRNPPLASVGATQSISPAEFLVQLTQAGAPARLRFLEGSDANDGSKRDETVKLLVKAAQTMDLTEPMRRVEKAVKLLWEESAAATERVHPGK